MFVLPLKRLNNTPLAFGTVVYNVAGDEVGYVAQGSQAYVKLDRLPLLLRICGRAAHPPCFVRQPSENHTNLCAAKQE